MFYLTIVFPDINYKINTLGALDERIATNENNITSNANNIAVNTDSIDNHETRIIANQHFIIQTANDLGKLN